MSLPRIHGPLPTCWLLRCLLGLALLLLAPLATAAGSMESALSPGVLSRAHAKWDDACRSCHTPFDRKDQDRLCADCHKDIGRDLADRTGLHGRMKPGQSCRGCHTEHKGRDMKIAPLDTKSFDHAQTDYLLRGRHREADCAKCHAPGRKYSAAPQDCQSCHRKDDVHKASLGPKCESCHDERSWRDTRFDHSTTRFPLLGAHDAARCEGCHKTREYKDTPRDCIACHRKDDKHEAQLGERCESCHDEQRWKGARFDHAKARFALAGAHLAAKCESCHQSLRYRDAPRDCLGCHRKDDKHKARLGAACESCHNVRAWRLWRFDHDRQTDYPLQGAHAKLGCESCHRQPAGGTQKIAPLQRSCVACHAKDDAHDRSFGLRCEQCHQPTSWTQVRNNGLGAAVQQGAGR